MSMKLTADAMGMRVGNPLRKLVLLKLCDNANEKGQCWPSVGYIADQCEISARSVMNHIAALEKAGFIEVRKRVVDGKKISNFYVITLNKAVDKVIHSSESPALLNPVSSESGSSSSESPALLSSESPAHRISHSLNQSIIQPVKIYKKISLDNLPLRVSEAVAKKWVDHCESVGKKINQDQFDRGMLESMSGVSLGLSPDEVILECVDAGWKSIKISWVETRLFGSKGIAGQGGAPPIGIRSTRDVSLAEGLTDRSWAE